MAGVGAEDPGFVVLPTHDLGRLARCSQRLINPTMSSNITAPMTALTIDPTKPANGAKPNRVSNQTPMNAPTIPMIMFQRSPKPEPRTMLPANQPAIAPTISMIMMLSTPIMIPSLMLSAAPDAALQKQA